MQTQSNMFYVGNVKHTFRNFLLVCLLLRSREAVALYFSHTRILDGPKEPEFSLRANWDTKTYQAENMRVFI